MILEQVSNAVVKIKYDCDGGFERCGKEWELKTSDALINSKKNNGKHICRQCMMKNSNPMHNKETIEKVKKKMEEKYGYSCAFKNPEKIAHRTEKMFGTPEAKEAILKKRAETNKITYGVEHVLQSEEVKKKSDKTMYERYGVKKPSQCPELLKKIQETNFKHYGNKCALLGREQRLKTIETMLKKLNEEEKQC